jgi:hypothetical protein
VDDRGVQLRRILSLLVQSPLCRKAVVVTRRHVAEFAGPKVQQVVVNMDTLEEELEPHAKGKERQQGMRACRWDSKHRQPWQVADVSTYGIMWSQ